MQKKLLFSFITFTGMSVACMNFELSKTQIFLSTYSIVIVLKEKHSLVTCEAITVMLGCFLHLTVFYN